MSSAQLHQSKTSSAKDIETTISAKYPSCHNNTLRMDSRDGIDHLHQPIGSQAVQRLIDSNTAFDFARIAIQPKMKISQPTDSYEEEADRLADQVMTMSISSPATSPRRNGESANNKCSGCNMKDEEEKDNMPSMSREVSRVSSGKITDGVTNKINNIRSSRGSWLDADTKELMESRFGIDFSNVRIHTDARAAESAEAINALAYTVGQNIVFGKRQYAPSTKVGKRLLAHELVHTVQQRTSGARTIGFQGDNHSEGVVDNSAQSALQATLIGHASSVPIGIARQFGTVDYQQLGNEELQHEFEIVRDRVLELTSYPERSADESYLVELERELRFRGVNIPLPSHPQQEVGEEGAREPAGGRRAVRGVRFVAPDFFGPTIELGETSIMQMGPDPSAGYNFDTYLLNETTGRRIPAQYLGGTRYRVFMGTPECPGCHFGLGKEVDLHGQHFLTVLGPQILAGVGGFRGGGPRIPPSRQLPPGPPTTIPPSRQLPPGPPTTIPPSRQLPPGQPSTQPRPNPQEPRQSPKRSEHAELRRREGRRVGPALNDAQNARQADVFVQSDGRYVVRGPRGREHIFEPDGTHITSLDRTRNAHQAIIENGGRRYVSPEEFERFKKIFR
jgi:Domain of unknown function (DUF4157)